MERAEAVARSSADICIGALAILAGDPSGGMLAAGGVAGLGALGLALRRKHATETGNAAARGALDALRHLQEFHDADLPRAAALLEMSKAPARLTAPELREAVMAAEDAAARATALADALHARLPFDGDAEATRALLRHALRAAMQTCWQDRTLQEHITRELLVGVARQTGGAVEILNDVAATTERTETKVDRILAIAERDQGASLDELRGLVRAFGGEGGGSRHDLLDYLRGKAADIARLSDEIAGLRGRTARIDNIAASASEAIRRGDLEEARRLLDNAREMQRNLLREPLENNAALMEKTAEIDLIEGRTEQAACILAAAADGFAATDPPEPARRRVEYAQRLIRHAVRYGGPGLPLAADMLRPAIDAAERAGDRALWATAQNNLGAALQAQGTRTGGAEGGALLAQAVTADRAALKVYTRADHPVDWAMTQNNLGNALQAQGTRTGGAEGGALLAQAVTAYRAALKVYTREDHPVGWAMKQTNLGNALREQRTRTGGAEGAALLEQAVAAYRAALEVYTRADHLVDWATTHFNMATAERDIADIGATIDPSGHLRAALRHVEAALEVFDAAHMTHDHQKAIALRDDLRRRLGG